MLLNHFEFAVSYKYDFAEAHNNLGVANRELGQINIVSNDTDVCAFCTFTADGELSGKGVHHFVVKDGLEVSFDLYWDSGYWAKHSKI